MNVTDINFPYYFT